MAISIQSLKLLTLESLAPQGLEYDFRLQDSRRIWSLSWRARAPEAKKTAKAEVKVGRGLWLRLGLLHSPCKQEVLDMPDVYCMVT